MSSPDPKRQASQQPPAHRNNDVTVVSKATSNAVANRTASTSPQRREQQRLLQLAEHDAAIAELFPDIPPVLEFESWWNERPKGHGNGGTSSEPAVQPPHRRFMLIRFFPETGQVEVQTDDAVVPLTIVVQSKSGVPLRCWDLYVGATIDILGRCTTLHAASFRTMAWLDENCRRLWRIKERMEFRLNRFVSVPRIALDYGPYKKLVQPSNGTKVQLGGLACPGKIARAILEIQAGLAKYQ
jgi:hypothetical protein